MTDTNRMTLAEYQRHFNAICFTPDDDDWEEPEEDSCDDDD